MSFIYRDEMSNMADRPLNDYIKEQFEQGAYPFDRDMVTTLELFDWLKKEARMKVSREREVANALSLIGGKCVKQVPIPQVGSRATLWIIRDHKKHGSRTAKELGKSYQPFFSDVRVKVTNRITDKPDPREPVEMDSNNY